MSKDKFQILNKAYNTIKNLDDVAKAANKWEYKPSKPDPNVSYSLKPFKVPKAEIRSIKQSRDFQAKLLAFYELKKKVTFADDTAIYIPITSKKLKLIFGCPKSVAKAIDVMIECGLLAEYNEKYRFNAKYNYSKQYIFHKPSWLLFVNYCKDNNILAYQYKNARNNNNESNNDTLVDHFDQAYVASRVCFTSKAAYYKPKDMSCSEFEQQLEICLRDNYKELFSDYQAQADHINETYFRNHPELQIQYLPNFTWNKTKTKVTKIGIRATNSVVSAKKCKEIGDAPNLIYRSDLMQQYGTMHEFDVKSSIARITFLLNTGTWLPMSIDLYQVIWNEMIMQEPSFAAQPWNNQTREIIKYFFMRGYFDTYEMIAAHTKRAISLKGNYNADEWKELDKVMKVYKKAVEKCLGGKLYDSEIFLHESNIYMSLAKHILSNGYKLMQIYDGFYTDKPVVDIESTLKQIALSYYEQYNKVKHANIIDISKEINQIKETCNAIINNNQINNSESNQEIKKEYNDTLVDHFDLAAAALADEDINMSNNEQNDIQKAIERERERLKAENIKLPEHIIKQRESEIAKQMADLALFRQRQTK